MFLAWTSLTKYSEKLIWSHANRIPRVWILNVIIRVDSHMLMFTGIYQLVFVIFISLHLYKFLKDEYKKLNQERTNGERKENPEK